MEEIIILLQRQDEKFILKFYNVNSGGTSSNERAPTLSPIIKVSTVLVRPNAVGMLFLSNSNPCFNELQTFFSCCLCTYRNIHLDLFMWIFFYLDKKALYLVNTSHNGAQIYDLVAASSSERKVWVFILPYQSHYIKTCFSVEILLFCSFFNRWFRRISEAADKHKKTDNRSRRSEAANIQPEDAMEGDRSKGYVHQYS